MINTTPMKIETALVMMNHIRPKTAVKQFLSISEKDYETFKVMVSNGLIEYTHRGNNITMRISRKEDPIIKGFDLSTIAPEYKLPDYQILGDNSLTVGNYNK